MTLAAIRALIFDVDGTLYRQSGLRRLMLWRLARAHVARPLEGAATLRMLSAYRQAQERLRLTADGKQPLAESQIALACRWTNRDRTALKACVSRWMEQEPLPLLSGVRADGLLELLTEARSRGVRLGVFSDYPAAGKLQALGVESFFEVIVSATDPDVQRLKPHPKGLLVTLDRLQVAAHEALYVGDRADVDVTAAAAAGIDAVLVGSSRRYGRRVAATTFHDLRRRLWPCQAAPAGDILRFP